MTVRIISGERRGAHIDTPEGQETRPLRDRIRQALFNMLRPEIRESVVLDAFAGSGAVGLEAISNGAQRAVFVDQSPAAADVIRRNVRRLRFEDRATVLQGSSPGIIAKLDPRHLPFTILFLMPPYLSNLCEPVLADAQLRSRLAPRCLAVCEIHGDEPPPAHAGWSVHDDRRYGITRLLTLVLD